MIDPSSIRAPDANLERGELDNAPINGANGASLANEAIQQKEVHRNLYAFRCMHASGCSLLDHSHNEIISVSISDEIGLKLAELPT